MLSAHLKPDLTVSVGGAGEAIPPYYLAGLLSFRSSCSQPFPSSLPSIKSLLTFQGIWQLPDPSSSVGLSVQLLSSIISQGRGKLHLRKSRVIIFYRSAEENICQYFGVYKIKLSTHTSFRHIIKSCNKGQI